MTTTPTIPPKRDFSLTHVMHEALFPRLPGMLAEIDAETTVLLQRHAKGYLSVTDARRVVKTYNYASQLASAEEPEPERFGPTVVPDHIIRLFVELHQKMQELLNATFEARCPGPAEIAGYQQVAQALSRYGFKIGLSQEELSLAYAPPLRRTIQAMATNVLGRSEITPEDKSLLELYVGMHLIADKKGK